MPYPYLVVIDSAPPHGSHRDVMTVQTPPLERDAQLIVLRILVLFEYSVSAA